MTEAQRERLRLDYLREQGSAAEDDVMLTPSVVFEAQAERQQEEPEEEEIQPREDPDVRDRVLPMYRFDPILGYIVPGENPDIVNSYEMSEADRKRILQKQPRIVTEQYAEIARIAAMGAVEREIEERFGDM